MNAVASHACIAAAPAAADQRLNTAAQASLVALARSVAELNPDAERIGAGRLRSLVADARRALTLTDHVRTAA